MPFSGTTYDRERDRDRLARQMKAVRTEMFDHQWHTLRGLSILTGAPEASVSARIRDLRKQRFGGYTVERRYEGNGLWAYRLLKPVPKP